MNTNLIGIIGKKRSGKDTISDYLIKNYGYQKYGFADPLKRGAKEIFGFTDEQLWGTQEQKETVDPRWGVSPRKILQIMGTELFQYDIHKYMDFGELPVGRAIWVHRFKIWFNEEVVKNPNIKLVFCDVRFKHEVDSIIEMGGEIWRVERPSITNESTHASEVEMDDIIPNKLIINNGTLEELYKKVENNLVMLKNGSMFAKTN